MPFNSILLVRRLYAPTLVPRPLTHPAKGIATRYPSKLVTDPSRLAHVGRRDRATTLAHMTIMAARELQDRTSDVLQRVAAGEMINISVQGEVVAELRPPARRRRAYLTHKELDQLFSRQIPDDHLAEDMEWIRV